MKTCDVCGKKTIFYNQFGDSCVCKSCMLRSGSVSWHRQFKRYEEANKQRDKVRASFVKHGFPSSVIDSIDVFFENQMNAMKPCECCSEKVSELKSLGILHICKKCYDKIDISEWREENYIDNVAVEKNRNKVLKIAKKNSFPISVTEQINLHFDRYIQQGLLHVIRGVRGQTLKVFETHCMLITDKHFDVDSSVEAFNSARKKNRKRIQSTAHNNVRSITKELLVGNVFNAVSKTADTIATTTANIVTGQKERFKIIKGTCSINYLEYDVIEFCDAYEDEVGFIRFHNTRNGDTINEDLVFLFNTNRWVREAYQDIIRCSSDPRLYSVNASTRSNSQKQVETVRVNSVSNADEILKYKNLLDIGAITQDEYEIKKKELLNSK